MMYFKNKQNEGFSLVETLVAISILLIVIVGPMTTSSRTAKSSTFATEQIQAFYLAQEGLELAQKVRDDFLLTQFRTTPAPNNSSWSSFIGSTAYQHCLTPNGCGLRWGNAVGSPIQSVRCDSSIDACKLYLSSNDWRSRYTHDSSGSITPFTRIIYFQTTVPGREVQVRSEVTWRTGSIVASQRVEVDTYLYNTYAQP
jgi:prepilin-type N-terminal cleavage/methylation domain-containing protein